MLDLHKCGRFYINKNITNAKLCKFLQTDKENCLKFLKLPPLAPYFLITESVA